MKAQNTTPAADQASRRENMMAIAREICSEFEKLHAHMDRILRQPVKKAA